MKYDEELKKLVESLAKSDKGIEESSKIFVNSVLAVVNVPSGSPFYHQMEYYLKSLSKITTEEDLLIFLPKANNKEVIEGADLFFKHMKTIWEFIHGKVKNQPISLQSMKSMQNYVREVLNKREEFLITQFAKGFSASLANDAQNIAQGKNLDPSEWASTKFLNK